MPESEHLLDHLAEDLAAASLALARAFAHGATLWCTAPAWPSHAQHVAVEFVHPVIVGKRAFPAVAVPGHDLVNALRTLARAGDVLLAIGAGDDEQVSSAMRRSQAWGLRTIWIGAGHGNRPRPGSSDYVLWLPGEEQTAPFSGDFVLLYHLLWELTHVAFEHPGLLSTATETCDDEVCITCSDEGRLAEVVYATAGGTMIVRTPAGEEEVDATLVDGASIGDLVLVHANSAVAVVEPA
jgi:phosphoheptose isomerase